MVKNKKQWKLCDWPGPPFGMMNFIWKMVMELTTRGYLMKKNRSPRPTPRWAACAQAGLSRRPLFGGHQKKGPLKRCEFINGMKENEKPWFISLHIIADFIVGSRFLPIVRKKLWREQVKEVLPMKDDLRRLSNGSTNFPSLHQAWESHPNRSTRSLAWWRPKENEKLVLGAVQLDWCVLKALFMSKMRCSNVGWIWCGMTWFNLLWSYQFNINLRGSPKTSEENMDGVDWVLKNPSEAPINNFVILCDGVLAVNHSLRPKKETQNMCLFIDHLCHTCSSHVS